MSEYISSTGIVALLLLILLVWGLDAMLRHALGFAPWQFMLHHKRLFGGMATAVLLICLGYGIGANGSNTSAVVVVVCFLYLLALGSCKPEATFPPHSDDEALPFWVKNRSPPGWVDTPTPSPPAEKVPEQDYLFTNGAVHQRGPLWDMLNQEQQSEKLAQPDIYTGKPLEQAPPNTDNLLTSQRPAPPENESLV